MADAKRPQTYQEQSFVINQIQKALPKTQAEIANQNEGSVQRLEKWESFKITLYLFFLKLLVYRKWTQWQENVPLEARSAFLSSFGTGMDGMFDPRLGLLGNGNGQFSQYLACPVNIPFCNRKPCTNRFGQLPQTAGECYSQPGCCFDHKLYLYKLSFGQMFHQHTPVCFQAIRKFVENSTPTFVSPWNL